MTQEAYFQKIKDFLEQKPISKQVVGNLKKGVEIGVIITGDIQCAYFGKEGVPTLERREANNPDIIFQFSPESIDTLVKNPGEDVGDFGIEVLKQYLAGEVKIKFPGRVSSFLRNGYLGILKDGGKKFSQFLAQHGVSSLTKIPGLIRKLRSE